MGPHFGGIKLDATCVYIYIWVNFEGLSLYIIVDCWGWCHISWPLEAKVFHNDPELHLEKIAPPLLNQKLLAHLPRATFFHSGQKKGHSLGFPIYS